MTVGSEIAYASTIFDFTTSNVLAFSHLRVDAVPDAIPGACLLLRTGGPLPQFPEQRWEPALFHCWGQERRTSDRQTTYAGVGRCSGPQPTLSRPLPWKCGTPGLPAILGSPVGRCE